MRNKFLCRLCRLPIFFYLCLCLYLYLYLYLLSYLLIYTIRSEHN
jgi:hypothetical protein